MGDLFSSYVEWASRIAPRIIKGFFALVFCLCLIVGALQGYEAGRLGGLIAGLALGALGGGFAFLVIEAAYEWIEFALIMALPVLLFVGSIYLVFGGFITIVNALWGVG